MPTKQLGGVASMIASERFLDDNPVAGESMIASEEFLDNNPVAVGVGAVPTGVVVGLLLPRIRLAMVADGVGALSVVLRFLPLALAFAFDFLFMGSLNLES